MHTSCYVFEGARDKDGNHNDDVIEKEIQIGNPNRDTDVYVIYVKGMTDNGGLTAAGSIVRHWETEPAKIDTIAPVRNAILPIPRNTWQPLQITQKIPKFERKPEIPERPKPPGDETTPLTGENFDGTGGINPASSRMTQDMKDYLDDLQTKWGGKITEIDITVNIGVGIMNDWNKVIRNGMINVDARTLRPSTSGRGRTILIPNTNDKMNLTNINSAINEIMSYLTSIFGNKVKINSTINRSTPNRGIIFNFQPK